MSEKTYSIKEVTGILDIEAYVLRYYEKELALDIHRNSQGHRIYSMKDIELLKRIKELREQGLELKAVKNVLNGKDGEGIESLVQVNQSKKKTTPQIFMNKEIDITNLNDMHVKQFTVMMKEMFVQALDEHSGTTKEEIKEEISQEMIVMVDKKMREYEVSQTEKNEEYYYKMTETMREMQRMQRELAEAKEVQAKVSIWRRWFGGKTKVEKEEIKKKESM